MIFQLIGVFMSCILCGKSVLKGKCLILYYCALLLAKKKEEEEDDDMKELEAWAENM